MDAISCEVLSTPPSHGSNGIKQEAALTDPDCETNKHGYPQRQRNLHRQWCGQYSYIHCKKADSAAPMDPGKTGNRVVQLLSVLNKLWMQVDNFEMGDKLGYVSADMSLE